MLALNTCPICASRISQKVPAELAPFLRIRCRIELESTPLFRCYCPACDFSFFDHRLDEKETLGLYRDYRGRGYRELREKLEPGSGTITNSNEDRSNDYHRTRIRQTAALLSQWGVRPRNVLDYGGEADAWLARGVFPEAEVRSYDLSEDMPIPPLGAFDLILCAHVLEHVSFPLPFLKDLERYLAPGGYIFAEVPYDPVGPLADTLLEGHPLNRMHEHLSFFTPRSLCRLLAASGLNPIHAGSFRATPHYRGIAALGRKSDTRILFPSLTDLPPLAPAEDCYAPLLTSNFERMEQLAQRWLVQGIRAVIYPAGNFSMEILAQTRMSEAIMALGDGDPRLHGRERMGKKVYSPEEIPALGAQILLIASPLHEDEIANQLASLDGPNLRLIRSSQVPAFEPFVIPPKYQTIAEHKSVALLPGHLKTLPKGLYRRQITAITKFIIVSHPRSGSNFLRDILNQHPHLIECGELFHNNPLCNFYSAEVLGKTRPALGDMDWLLTNAATSGGIKTAGFTLFNRTSGHVLSDTEAVQLALRDDVRVIFLVRKNLLKAYVSLQRALSTGAWHVDAMGNPIQWPHIQPAANALDQNIGSLDVGEARGWISQTKEFLSYVEQSLRNQNKDYCMVFYEDLCLENRSRTMFEVNRILQFLELHKLENFQNTHSKVASHSFYKSIQNRQELVSILGYDLD